MRSAGAVSVLLAFLVLLTGCDGLRTKPSAEAQPPARLPEWSPEQAAYDLLDALLSSPLPSALPPGYTTPAGRDAAVGFNPKVAAPGSQGLGGVIVLPTGPNALDQFGFTVAATTEAAEVTFGLPPVAGGPVTETFTPAGVSGPARCNVVAAPQPGVGGFTACRALVGTVGVFATTRSRSDPQRGSDADSVALVRAGVAHLAAVQAAQARAAATPPTTRVVRVGLLSAYWTFIPRGFHERLAELGWVRGRNLVMEYRFYEDQTARLPELAADLVQARVDVLVADNSGAARAAKAATTTLPVVFLLYDDAGPVAAELVQSYARPGSNLTGVTWPSSASLAAKRLEVLTEAVPAIRRVGVLVDGPSGPIWRELEETARARGVELVPLVVRSRADLAGALAEGAAAGAQALLMTDLRAFQAGDFNEYYQPIIRFAQQQRLPLVPPLHGPAQLLSYAASYPALWALAAAQVDRLLHGATPSQTPVEQVKEIELTVNLGEAQNLGLTIAPSVLQRATEVVQPGAVTPTRVR